MEKVYAVEYKNPNFFTFQLVLLSQQEIEARKGKPKDHKFKPEELRMFYAARKDKIFKPGINLISESELHFLREHPEFERLFDETDDARFGRIIPPSLEWVPGRGPDDFKGEFKAGETILTGLKDRDALKIVRKTLDKDILLAWKEMETREEISKAIDGQLEKLKPGYSKAA